MSKLNIGCFTFHKKLSKAQQKVVADLFEEADCDYLTQRLITEHVTAYQALLAGAEITEDRKVLEHHLKIVIQIRDMMMKYGIDLILFQHP